MIESFLLIFKCCHVQKSQTIVIFQIINSNIFWKGIKFIFKILWFIVGNVFHAFFCNLLNFQYDFSTLKTLSTCTWVGWHCRHWFFIQISCISTLTIFFFNSNSQKLWSSFYVCRLNLLWLRKWWNLIGVNLFRRSLWFQWAIH